VEFRVRLHEGELARIEVSPDAIAWLSDAGRRAELTERMLQLGFRFVTLDLVGFRSGSMNELIPLETKRRFQRPAQVSS